MSVTGTRVTVTTSPTPIAVADADGATVSVYWASGTLDLGGATVASGAGFGLPAGSVHSQDLDAGETLYGIAASDTITVHVIKNRA